MTYFDHFDEINAELREIGARALAEEEEEQSSGMIFIGSGEDICIFKMQKHGFKSFGEKRDV